MPGPLNPEAAARERLGPVKAGRVLDVATGGGGFILRLAPLFAGYASFTGIDLREEPLVAAMKAANAAVYQQAQVDPACRGMGTTAVGIRREEDLIHLCHCGDSRAYLLRGGQLTQMTHDHSLINLYKERPDLVGQLGPATSNVIIRAIGLDTKVEIDHRTVAMEHGDVYMLCCDGLSDLVADWMIREIMTSGETMEVVTANLIRAANANGGTDNITVIVIQIFDERQLYGAR